MQSTVTMARSGWLLPRRQGPRTRTSTRFWSRLQIAVQDPSMRPLGENPVGKRRCQSTRFSRW